MQRRALLKRLGGAGAATGIGGLAGVGTVGRATGHPDDGGSAGTETGPSGTGRGPHSKLPMEEAREAVVDESGTTAYVATMDGFASVDVADPHDPTILATVDGVLADHENGPLTGIQDVKVDGDDLLVLGPAHPGASLKAAVLYDVSDPAAPEFVGAHETDYFHHNGFLLDGIAYLTGNGATGNPLVVVEMGEEPTELGRWSILDHDSAWADVPSQLRVLHDLWVHGDLAYLAYWDAGTWIVDVSEPESPSFVSRVRGRPPDELPTEPQYAVIRENITPPGNDHYVTTSDDGTLLGIGSESWAFQGSGGPSGITFYDVSDPESPQERGHIEHPPTDAPSQGGVWTTAHNFELTDGYCYSSWYQGGVKIHDVSDPNDPIEEYHWRESDAARFWTAQLAVPGRSFVAPSMGLPAGDEGETPTDDAEGAPALYVFPDPVHEPPTDAPTPTSTATDDATSVLGPGFGAAGAVASALGLGAWWAHRSGADFGNEGGGRGDTALDRED